MNTVPEHALTKSLRTDDGDQARSQSPRVTTTGLVRPSRSTQRSARRDLVAAVLASAVLFGGIAGVGVIGVAAEAAAKPPRETTNNGVCTEIADERRLMEFDIKAFRGFQQKLEAASPFDGNAWQDLQDSIDYAHQQVKVLDRQARANRC